MCNEFITMPGTFSFGRKNKGQQKGTMQIRFLLKTFVERIVAGLNSQKLILAFETFLKPHLFSSLLHNLFQF